MVYKSGHIFLPFVTIYACDRQTDWRTDRRTDRILITIPRLHYMQRGKNETWIEFRRVIKALTLPADTTCSCSLFHSRTTRTEKKCWRARTLESGWYSFILWPLILLDDHVKNSLGVMLVNPLKILKHIIKILKGYTNITTFLPLLGTYVCALFVILHVRLTSTTAFSPLLYYRAACNADAVLWWDFCPSVRPSVRLSVCLSHAWIVTKR